jgi:glycosyltransferase involved in cell wall biosynthesis
VNKENDKPLVSIITVCYNSEETLRRTIQSVYSQKYSNIDNIVENYS